MKTNLSETSSSVLTELDQLKSDWARENADYWIISATNVWSSVLLKLEWENDEDRLCINSCNSQWSAEMGYACTAAQNYSQSDGIIGVRMGRIHETYRSIIGHVSVQYLFESQLHLFIDSWSICNAEYASYTTFNCVLFLIQLTQTKNVWKSRGTIPVLGQQKINRATVQFIYPQNHFSITAIDLP